jgi:hypothetical protein
MSEPSMQDAKRLILRAIPDPEQERVKPSESVKRAKLELQDFAVEYPDLVVETLAQDPRGIAPFRDLTLSLLETISEDTRVILRDALCGYIRSFGREWSPRVIQANLTILGKMPDSEVFDALLDRISYDMPPQSRMHLSTFATVFEAIDTGKTVRELTARLLSESGDLTWTARGQIAEVLGYMRDQQAVEPLKTVLQRLDDAGEEEPGADYCRQYTLQALERLGVHID